MAVHLNQQDLVFILRQIKIAEAHASGIDLTELRVDAAGNLLTDRSLYNAQGVWNGAADAPRAIPDPHVPYGLRTVDGTFNNIVPGREEWGSSGQPMPQMFEPHFINENDGDVMSLGPGAPVITNNDYGTPGSVADADPRLISNLVVDASLGNPAAIAAALRQAGSENILQDQREITMAYEAVRSAAEADRPALQLELDALLAEKGITVTNGSIDNLNVAPDEGLSKPFNAWMTFFGQFFDHGLDLISKGGPGVGTVYIPLAADDPLVTHGADGVAGTGDEVGPQSRFMVLTRATPVGADGDQQRNVTTPFVDQNQTYTSNASHQVFLREYEMVGGRPVSTGLLLGGENGGLATWADVKEQARTMLGIDLRDSDVTSVPQLLTDPYGAFIPSANGMPQVMARTSTGDIVYVSGTAANPLVLSANQVPAGGSVVDADGEPVVLGAGVTFAVARTFNAFLDDIAHNAVPVLANGVLVPDADTDTGNAVAVNPQTGRNLAYDNELLDRHFITGDGRGNENIGLTTVHHIFHSEHNRQVEAHKLTVLRSGDLAFINEWLDTPVAGLPANFAQMTALQQTAYANTLDWDGERLFQSGRFATEMQYQHLVFEEFARKVQPQIDPFVFNSVTEIDPSIFAEFANTVYRFGHSMLTENMPRIGADGQPLANELGLVEAFLNPVSFDDDGAMGHDEAAAAIIRGMTVERGSEIDEFVVGALRNNLLGLPLDLAAINIARGRDTGTPTLNEARAQLYAATNSTFLTPYTSWADMAGNLKNPMSVVNFIAAYGTHPLLVGTSAEKRAVAMELVLGVEADGVTPSDISDRLAFVNGTGTWTPAASGLNAVDLWIGGLAEKQMPFGGLLGSTFNAIFEAQMENLQDADRFYYLTRTQGQNFLNELEQNSFSKLMLANTDLALAGPDGIRGTGDDIITRHIGIDAFADYDFELEVNAANQSDQNGAAAGVDPTGNDPILEAMGRGKVMRDDPGTTAVEANYLRFTGGEHVLVGGTNGNDTIVTDFGDDAIWGDAGDDRIESGAGVDLVNGGDGDDIITDSGDSGDFLKGEGGNDVIANSNGLDILMGGTGKDVVFVGVDTTEVFAGAGDDFVLGGDGADFLMGNEGDDWIEAGGGFDTTAGDNSELFFNSAIKGHDVMFAGNDEHDFDAESGDDIMVQGESVMRNEGMFGFDWAIFKGNARDGHADMRIPIFTTEEADILRNRFDKTEALSGWDKNDTLIGDDRTAADGLAGEAGGATVGANENVFFNDGLDQAGIDRIAGLSRIVSVGANGVFEAGNILLGGKGSDVLQGNGGDDILDGDRWLNVRIRITRPDNPATPGNESTVNTQANQLTTVDSLKHTFTQAQVTADGLPAAWVGKSLFELLVSRDVRPDQMHIVREIVTPGAVASEVDTAVFNDVRANYVITRGTGAEAGTITVRHATQSNPAVDDGTDTLRNMERLRFADGEIDVALILNQPFERLNIVATNGDIGRFDAVFTGLVAGRPVTVQWQVLDNGTWRNVTGADGVVANAPGGPAGDRFTPNNPNVEIRAVANWTSTIPNTPAQRTLSVETAFVGTANDDDMPGSAASNVILGLAGDDDIEGGDGIDTIDGGDGDDRIDGNDGDDILVGNDGDDQLIGRVGDDRLQGGVGDDTLSGGTGNDALDGGAGTDTAIVTGPVSAYTFERTGAVITVTDNLGLEGDGRDTLTGVELLQVGDTDVYAIGAAGTAGVDIVVGTAAAETLAGGAGNDLIFAGGGNDSVTWRPGDGRDFVDGGAGNDTFRILDGSLPVQQLGLAAARAQFPALTFRDDTQTVVVRGGVVIAELKDVEAASVNTQATGVPTIVDPTPTNGLVSPTEGQPLTISTAGIADANGLGTFSFAWQTRAADGVTWNTIAGANGQSFTPGQAQVGAVLRARVSFTDGQGNPEEVFSAPTNVVGDDFTGTPLIGLTFNGTAGDDIANGANAALLSNDVMNGNGGNDIINGRAGNDRITQLSVDGRDRVDGGSGTDTYVLNGVAAAEIFRIYALTAGQNAGLAASLGTTFAGTTEIVITRTVGGTTTVVAELDNIEEISVNTLNVSANDGGGPNQGPAGNDTVAVFGDFTSTSLNFSTITIDGAAGDDTVDISALTSAHRIVFRSNGGHDTIVGTLRPQDVIELAQGGSLADYVSTVNANGTTTLSNGSHSITYATSGTPIIREEADPPRGAFEITPRDLEGLKKLVNGELPFDDDDDAEGALGPREVSGENNNAGNPHSGQADTPFIRLTEARYGDAEAATGNRALNPIYDGLDPRLISNILGAQEANLPHADNEANIFFMAFGQYVDHGLDFLPKNAINGTIQIGAPGTGHPGQGNPADLTRGEVYATEDGVPQHLNKTSAYVDQNQAYGSHNLVTQFLREGDGNGGLTSHLLKGAPDPSNPSFNLLPTLREAIQHHWDNNTIFHDPSLPGGQIAFRDYYSNYPVSEGVTGDLIDATGGFDPQVYAKLASNFMASGQALLLDSNPFISALDHYVAGDGRANENFALTSMHTIWARNHNFHADQLEAAGFQGTEQELFDAAKIINEAEYQRVVFNEYADTLLGGLRSRDGSGGDHGHDGYNEDADAGISHEFAAAAFRFGHSLIGQTLTVIDENGQPKQVSLVDAFLNPTNDAGAFAAPLPPGYVPQPGYAQYGVGAILEGVAQQPAEAVDFNVVDAIRNDLVRIQADLFSFNLARGRDVGLGTMNQIRKDLANSTNSYVEEAVGFAGDMSAYTSWEDFQARNNLSDAVIAQFKQAYPDLVLDTPAKLAAFVAANPDIELVNGNTVKGIDRVDFWLGGLAEKHVNGGMVGQTFWVVLHEQFDRLQESDRFYYKDRLEAFDFYDAFIDGQEFSDIVARNTGLTDLAEHIFEVADEDDGDDTGTGNGDDDDDDDTGNGDGDDDEDDEDDDTTGGGDDDEDDEDDTTGGGDDDDDEEDDDTTGGDDDEDDDEEDDEDDAGCDGNTTGGGTTNPPSETTSHLVAGTANADVLSGTAGADTILGLGGDDNILSGDGADVIRAGDGNDFVDAGGGRDVIFGGAGNDDIMAGSGDDMVYGDAGADRIFGGAGNDVVTGGSGNDELMGGDGNDLFVAEVGDGDDTYWGDEIGGGAGNDTLDMSAITANITAYLGPVQGGRGHVVSAQSGTDSLLGIENLVTGSGNDVITAGDAVNVMDGGLGADTYRFETAAAANGDTIMSFQPGDKVDLAAIDANQEQAGNQAFTLATGSAFTGVGQLLITQEHRADGDYTVIEGNTGGDATPEFRLSIKGTPAATAADFNL